MKRLLAVSLMVWASWAQSQPLSPFISGSLQQIVDAQRGKPFVLMFWSLDCTHCQYDLQQWGKRSQGKPAPALVLVAVVMLVQSLQRLLSPQPIHYDEAIAIGTVGLLVNLACAWLLRGGHHHGHSHDHGHGHSHGPADHHHDLNLRSAYLHVLADAATSVLAIVALFGGKLWGFDWLDPVMGLVGAVLVAVWAQGLLRDAGKVLLDAEMDAPVVEEIREVIAASPVPASISDLHVWRVGRGDYACIVSLVTAPGASPEYFKQQLRVHEELVHITVELHAAG